MLIIPPEPKVTAWSSFFGPANSPNPQIFSFTVKNDKEILTLRSWNQTMFAIDVFYYHNRSGSSSWYQPEL